MKSVKQKRLAKAVFKKATSTNGGKCVDLFQLFSITIADLCIYCQSESYAMQSVFLSAHFIFTFCAL